MRTDSPGQAVVAAAARAPIAPKRNDIGACLKNERVSLPSCRDRDGSCVGRPRTQWIRGIILMALLNYSKARERPRGRGCLGYGQSGLFGTFTAYGAFRAYRATVESDNATAWTSPGSTVGETCGSGRRDRRCRHDERSCRRSRCGWQLVVAATAKSDRQNNCSRATEQRERLTSLRFH
jgi:hypothetical protein